MNAYAREPPDVLEVAKARAEYGEAYRTLAAAENDLAHENRPEMRAKLSRAEARVNVAPAKLRTLTGRG